LCEKVISISKLFDRRQVVMTSTKTTPNQVGAHVLSVVGTAWPRETLANRTKTSVASCIITMFISKFKVKFTSKCIFRNPAAPFVCSAFTSVTSPLPFRAAPGSAPTSSAAHWHHAQGARPHDAGQGGQGACGRAQRNGPEGGRTQTTVGPREALLPRLPTTNARQDAEEENERREGSYVCFF